MGLLINGVWHDQWYDTSKTQGKFVRPWLLSHSPRWRDTWSDAAHARREVARVVDLFVAALKEEDTLTPAQRERVLLRVRAKGLALQAAEEEQYSI